MNSKLLITGFLQPVFVELIYRDCIYTYVETNFANAFAINFVMIPILSTALSFDPRQTGVTLIAQPIAAALFGALLTGFRASSGGLSASIAANITYTQSVGILTLVALVIKIKRHQNQLQKEEALAKKEL